MSAAQELFELLKDARPKGGNRPQPIGTPQKRGPVPAALKAVRFSVELPELGGAVELSPYLGFEPVLCVRCGAPRPTEQYQPRTVTVLPCTSCPLDLGVRT